MTSRTFSHLLAVLVAVLAAAGLYAYAFSAELPVGALRGQLLAADTKKPLAGITLVLRPGMPKDGMDTLDAKTDDQGHFEVPRLPAGNYEITPHTTAYKSRSVKTAVLEGKTAEATIKLDPGDPYLNLNVHQHAFLPGDDPRIALNGFRQGDAVKLRIFTVDPETMLNEEASKLREMLTPVSSGRRGAEALRAGKVRLLRTIDHSVKKRDAEGVFYDFEQLGQLKPGVYLLQAEGDKDFAVGWLMVTDLALITKSAEGKVNAFTVDLRTGVPVPDTQVVVYQGRNIVRQLKTDANGRVEFTAGSPSDQLSAVARRGDSVAFMNFRPFGNAWYGEDGKPNQYRMFTYTDRPVYRPGHRVLFKGVVRHLERNGYSVPSPKTVSLEVHDEQQTVIYHGQTAMNDRGSFAGQFDLSSEATPGMYTLTTKLAGEESSETFKVAAYRKPEWRVEVTSPKKSYVRGDQVAVTISAQYYYGAPVADAKVEYTVVRSQYWSYLENEDDQYLYGQEEETHEGGIYGDVVENGEARTDADGIAHVTFSSKSGDASETGDFEYTVQANVIDLSDRSASGDLTVRVNEGQFRLDAKPSRYVAPPGEQVTIEAKLQDLDQKPVPNAPVEIKAVLQMWDRRGSHEKQLSSTTVNTDAKGLINFPLTLSDTGSVTVRLTNRDPRGNKVEATTDVWVSSYDGGDYGGNYPSISLVPDRKEYHIGDTAQILINVEKPGATAIVAAEAVRVLDLQQVVLKKKSTVVRFPIREGHEPNFFVTACFVRDREFITNQVVVRVNPENHQLNVRIESDRQQYHPGDTATFKIRTTDPAGKPLPAEVSFGVVDEAVYAIQEEPKKAMWQAFYPRRYNEVLTEFSFPQIYLGDADKDGAQVAIRKKFPDTAFWDPFVRTDRSGQATVKVTLPDSLTSWRATATAITAATKIGRQTLNVTVAKELTLRLQTPRSITEGDTLNVSAIAHNYTKTETDVAIELSARGVELRENARQTVHLKPEEAKRVDWEIKATAPGDAVFTATARAGSFSDGLELTVPVRAFARQDVEYRAGAVTESEAVEELELDSAAARGTLEIRLAPSLAGATLGALDYLATFPYGCVEQTMSSFLPDVVLTRSLRQLNLPEPKQASKLPEMTTAGLLRLYGMQHEDGGWGWWQYDQSDPWMTAYVMFGLDLARQNGYDLNPQIRANGLNALKQISEDAKLSPDDAQFVAYALALNGADKEAGKLIHRFDKKIGKLQRRSQAYRVLALLAMGGLEERSRAAAALEDLWSVSDAAGGMYHWSEERKERYTHVPQDVESTALVLKAALALDPKDNRIPGIVRWLLVKRNGGRWISTRDTAWILLSLTDYLRFSGELNPDYRLTVSLNDRELKSEAIGQAEAQREEEVIRIPLSELKEQNRIVLRKEGAGTLYYSVRLTQEIRTTAFAPESTVPGLSLKREYFLLTTRRDANGHLVTLPGDKPVTKFRVGDRLLVRLTLTSSHALEYLMIEDPLPAGCEVQERGDIPFAEWDYWWSNLVVRDDRVAFFTRDYGAEEKSAVLEYYLRPEHSGQIQALPTVLEDMYNPAVRASTSEARLEIGK